MLRSLCDNNLARYAGSLRHPASSAFAWASNVRSRKMSLPGVDRRFDWGGDRDTKISVRKITCSVWEFHNVTAYL